MCRLAAFSNLKVKGKWLDYLTLVQGGDGNGFIYPTPDIDMRKTKEGRLHHELFGDFVVSKWYIEPEVTIDFEVSTIYYNFGIAQEVVEPKKKYRLVDYEHMNIASKPWLLFHTRLASAGERKLENVHPAIAKNVLLMQNGHDVNFTKKLAKAMNYSYLGTDYHTIAWMLADGVIKPELLLLSTSNWFIIDIEKRTFTIVSAKEFDPLFFHKNGKGFYIASEQLETNHKGFYFTGIIHFNITSDGLEILDEDIEVHEK
ncbi:MAG: hypothetical protein ACP5PP_00305 [Fervidobacterium sp.]